jgi:mannose-6-phosphate isomerase
MPTRPKSIALEPRLIEKPWGRTRIPGIFGSTGGRRIGELWFEHPGGNFGALLVKYIFTSERLSIQVHPNDGQARERGLPAGKSECWYVLDADEGATLGLGLTVGLSPDEIRSVALDGSIERLMNWRSVAPGDFIYVPAGTIHAIGAGIELLEFQQNTDVTYRLYDYGRPRELHLDDGVAVSISTYDVQSHFRPAGDPVNTVLASTPHFSLVRANSNDALPTSLFERRRWAMPLQGSVSSGGRSVGAGGCLLVEAGEPLTFSESSVILVGAEGLLDR